jgi:hypothetical protein
MLENLKNTNPFTVPEGYFEQFHAQLEAKIEQETQGKRSALRISFYQKMKPYLMAAAVFGVLFTVLQTVNKPMANTPADISTSPLAAVTNVADNNDLLYSDLMTDEYSFCEYIENE